MNEKKPTLYLKPNGVNSLGRGHRWIFSGAVIKETGQAKPGEIISLADQAGRFVAWAWNSPGSKIRARVLSRQWSDEFPEGWWRPRLERAVELRRPLIENESQTAFRLLNAEADALPGLTIDLLGGTAVLSATCAGSDLIKAEVAAWLRENQGVELVLERADPNVRRLEGLPKAGTVISGEYDGERVTILENGVEFAVDPLGGWRLGWYSDQRRNRALISSLAKGRRVLDCFSYNGGFGIQAIVAKAKSATLIDSSAKAHLAARATLRPLGLTRKADLIQGDVFQILRQYIGEKRKFDLIILDPPSQAHSKGMVEKAVRTYTDLLQLALSLVTEGGLIAAFSRSAAIGPEHFREIVQAATEQSGVRLRVLQKMGQAEDLPAPLGMPEMDYLKGLLLSPE